MANDEQNMAVIAKRIWGIVRVVYFMLRKGVSSKRNKLLLDLNVFMKRGKLAGKAAIATLAHRRTAATSSSGAADYEFSCTNTPAHAPATRGDDAAAAALRAALELIGGGASAEASPALAGFLRSPAVRQLRVTDSPYPLREADDVDSRPVDEAAEEFIRRFYKDLSRQRLS